MHHPRRQQCRSYKSYRCSVVSQDNSKKDKARVNGSVLLLFSPWMGMFERAAPNKQQIYVRYPDKSDEHPQGGRNEEQRMSKIIDTKSRK